MANFRGPKAKRPESGWPGRSLLAAAFFLLVFPPANIFALGHEMLPPDHWSYLAFSRFEALGLVDLPSEKPFSRDQAEVFVEQIRDRAETDTRSLSARGRFDLERLEKEFTAPDSRVDPRKRYNPPIFFLTDSPHAMEGDWDVALSGDKSAFDDKADVLLTSHPSLKLHLGDHVSYDFRYRLVFGPERDERAQNQKPSPRERSVSGMTALFERSSVRIQWDKVALVFGREYTDWGPAKGGNLLVSQNAGSFDQVGARFQFKNLRLSFFNAILSPESRRYLAGHRLEARFGWAVLGVSETVVYADREFDPIYMLPLASFYGNQFNERGDDNVLWSVDAKVSVVRGLLVYGSLLIDDFQYERGDGAPDKLGFDLGWQLALSQPIALTVSVNYRYIDIYTYTHRDSTTGHVTGSGLLDEGERLIGGNPGPDSDGWTAELSVYPRPDLTLSFNLFHQRVGEGNDFRRWVRPMSSFPPFPSGVVERTLKLGLLARWELPRGSGIQAEVSRTFVNNRNHYSGQDEDGTAFRLAVSWDI
jgi:hypothetical protein